MEQFISSIDRVLSCMDTDWECDPFPVLADAQHATDGQETFEDDVSCLKPRRSDEKYKCRFCAYRVGETVAFRDHVALKHAGQYLCLKCMGKRLSLFDSRNDCYSHISNAHGIRGPHAQALTQSVAKRLLVDTIQQFRTNSKLRNCPGEESVTNVSRNSQPILVCEICKTYQTDAVASYVAHRMAHRNLRPYQCPICGFRANFRSNVRKHIRSCHRDSTKTRKVMVLAESEARKTILAYLDSQKERKGFNPGTAPDLTVLANLQCKFCRFQTPFSQVLKLHYLKAHSKTYTKNCGRKPTGFVGKRCSICKKHRAACKSRARLHWALWHLRRPVKIACGSCKRTFKDSNSLLSHWQNMHAKLADREQACVILVYRLSCTK